MVAYAVRSGRDADSVADLSLRDAGIEVHDLRRPDDGRPSEQWAAYRLDADRFDPALCLVAMVDGQVVGAATGQATPGHGFVRQLAVDPAQRGRGPALAKAGMRVVEQFTRWERTGTD